jgi:RHS repeat-associated protein
VGTEEVRLAGLQITADSQSALESGKAVVDEADSVTGLKSFRIETDGKDEVVVAKRLSLPSRVPFGVSEGNFVIGVAKTASQMRTISRSRLQEEIGLGDLSDRSREEEEEEEEEEDQVSRRKSETANEEQVPGIAKARGASSGSSGKTMKMMSASPVGSFYIYSFDGKLLQLYNVYGTLLKDYIYMGDRLIAEYDHVGARFLYYTPDQINTTRVVTDGSGTVVYSAVHDPYGGIQQTGTNNTYDPQLKFSGKERDAESQLDYFGARYYDRSQYRFISVDPALNPKPGNQYAYCGNSPISYFDPTGAIKVYVWVSSFMVPVGTAMPQDPTRAGGTSRAQIIPYLALDENGNLELVLFVMMNSLVCEEGHGNYKEGLPFAVRTVEGTTKHEERHYQDVANYIYWMGGRIEKALKARKISYGQLIEAVKSLEKKASDFSNALRHGPLSWGTGDWFWDWIQGFYMDDYDLLITVIKKDWPKKDK